MVGKTKTTSKASPDQDNPVAKSKKSPGRPKSPGRSKSPGRPKSPGRTKSPARTSPSRTRPETVKATSETPTRSSTRTRSPARLRNTSPTTSTPRSTPILTPSRRSPIRRSPARLVKEPSEDKERDIPLVRPRKKIIVDTDTDSDNAESVPEKLEKPKAMVRGRSRRKDFEIEPEDKGELKAVETEGADSIGLVHRFTRASQNREIERVVHLKHFDSVTITKRLGEFSDEDDVLIKKSQTELQEFSDTKNLVEFGGLYGALISIVALPVFVIALNVICNEEHCSFTKLPDLKGIKSLSTYFNATASLCFVAYLTLVALLSALPFGGLKVAALPNKHGKFCYVMNGLFSCIVLLLIGGALELRRVPIADFMIVHTLPLLVASIFCGIVVSVYAYVRSFYAPVSALNAYVIGKPGVYGFFLGREVNPRIFSTIDLKLLFFRSCIFGTIFIDFAFLYNSLDISSATKISENKAFDPKLLHLQQTLLIYVLLHSIIGLDILIFESVWVSSFEAGQEAFGYLTVMGFLTYPFISSLIPKHIISHGVELASWKLVLISLTFSLGYILYRASNNQKDAFRKNPYSPALSHLETIPTTQGKKLLISGFWGIVRHPNYLGDILMHLSFVPFVWCAPPILYPVGVILLLIHRSVRDNARCRLKYGAAWDRYCNRVKHVLIPKVF
ncbi:lamin-B receptor [Anoplophora glabripennis]|uniref:lamin-B receptor n=1 Tax=Anoplophora glabripennis TaxID=217634 RepID=UPI00087364AD|nr:lamin-B receptor [Anoplophora glabripennis]